MNLKENRKSETLYRLYRPSTFNDLVGQEQVSRILSNRIKKGDISHGFLFCGPRGTGKTSVARILARALNCTNLSEDCNPCLVCENCKRIEDNSFMDLFEIDAASHRGIDDIRQIQEELQFSPTMGGYKIYILDEVHMLTEAASNALLKTLEEPPPGVIFVFCTTEPQKVIPTMLSRLERHDFSRHTPLGMVGRMKYIIEKEQARRPMSFPSFEEPALYLIGEISEGSLRDSLTTLEQLSLLKSGSELVTSKDVQRFFNRLESHFCFQIFGYLIEKDPSQLFSTLAKIYEEGAEYTRITEDLIVFCRKWILYKLDPEQSRHFFSEGDKKYLEKLNPAIDLPTLLLIQKKLFHLSGIMRENPFPQGAFEMTLLELCLTPENPVEVVPSKIGTGSKISPLTPAPPPVKTPLPTALKAIPNSVELKPSPQVVPPQLNEEDSPVPEKSYSNENHQGLDELINLVQKEAKGPLYAMLKEAKVVSWTENQISLGFGRKYSFHLGRIKEAKNLEIIQKCCESLFGKGLTLEIDFEDLLVKTPPHSGGEKKKGV